VILLSNLGLGLDHLLMALAPTLALLFVGRVISGATAASISTAGAYIADVEPPERRARGFGLISIAFGVGFVLGPALGGLLGAIGPRLPFWAAAALSLLNAGWGALVLPESLPPERRAAFAWRRANPLGALALLRARSGLPALAGMSFLGFLARTSLPAVFVLQAGYRYGWGQRTIGLALATIGVCAAAVGGLLVQPLLHALGERRTLLLGLACGAAGFADFALAPTGGAFWAGIPVMALWGVCPPVAQAMMSRRVLPTAQGQLQGAWASLIGLAGLLGPGLFTAILARAIIAGGRPASGAPFLVAAGLLLASLLLALRITRLETRFGFAGDAPEV
jgi:DHA1 family tetracycline resistance protein-like MFS transporter